MKSYTCDGEEWVSGDGKLASSSSMHSSSSYDDFFDRLSSVTTDSILPIQHLLDSIAALYASSSSWMTIPMLSSSSFIPVMYSSSLPTFLFSSSSAMISSSGMVASSSSSYVLPTTTHGNVFSWNGADGIPFVKTDLDNGTETAGYWFTFDDSPDGGLSYIDWPVSLGNDYDSLAMDPVIDACGGVCGTVHLEAGILEYYPFVGVAFNIAGAMYADEENSIENAALADASAWGGICITYTSDLPATLELGFGAYKDSMITFDYPFVSLSKSAYPDERCFEWSKFKQAGWGMGDKITGEEAGADLASVKFKIQTQDGSVGQFNIMRISSYY